MRGRGDRIPLDIVGGDGVMGNKTGIHAALYTTQRVGCRYLRGTSRLIHVDLLSY